MGYQHIPDKPTLIIFCGLPGSGKTTTARQLNRETGAVRLCTDEWLADLGIDFFDEAAREKIEQRLWKLGKGILRLNQDVILENGLWSRQERDEKRREAVALNVVSELHYFDVPFDELWHRLEKRNTAGHHGTVPLTKELLASYQSMFQPPDKAELSLFDRYVIHVPGEAYNEN